MIVRLGFAVAAHLEPEILVFDEVLAVGDDEFQKKALGKMEDISQGEGRTVLFVSHNLTAIEKISNRAILLFDGKIHIDDLSHEVIKKYLNDSKEVNSKNITGRYILNNNKRGIFKIETYCDKSISYFFYTNCHFKLKAFFQDTHINQDTVFGIVIHNMKDESFIGINNAICGSRIFKQETHSGWIEIEIPIFSIYGEGEYKIDLYLGNHNFDYEIIKNIVTFYLNKTDIYLSGKFLDDRLNKFVLPKINFHGFAK